MITIAHHRPVFVRGGSRLNIRRRDATNKRHRNHFPLQWRVQHKRRIRQHAIVKGALREKTTSAIFLAFGNRESSSRHERERHVTRGGVVHYYYYFFFSLRLRDASIYGTHVRHELLMFTRFTIVHVGGASRAG